MSPAEVCGKILGNIRLTPTGCWEYQGHIGAGGYGRYSGRAATRFVAAVHHGLDMDDKSIHVCHSCDNPPCVNPTHLFLGSASDNARDAIAKGRRSATPASCGPWDFCAKGHDLSTTREPKHGGGSHCAVCRRERHAAGERRRRVERKARAAA